MSAFVQVSALDKVYGGTAPVVALDNIDLDIDEGEFVSVVGPSGCGKSTLLRCVAGLESRTAGMVLIRGEEVNECPLDLGIVFQTDTLVDWRNILDNVLLVAEFKRLDRNRCERRARELMSLFGLGDFMLRHPWELSGGMRQRAAICRALVDDPGLLLMDEPFGALDAMTRDQLNVELQRIWLESRKTVMFITHSIAEAVFLSDRVIMMAQSPGRVIESIAIELPRPRHLAIRETPEFAVYVSRIRELFMSLGILKDP